MVPHLTILDLTMVQKWYALVETRLGILKLGLVPG